MQSSRSLGLERGRERLWEAGLPGLEEKGLLYLGRTPRLVACAIHAGKCLLFLESPPEP